MGLICTIVLVMPILDATSEIEMAQSPKAAFCSVLLEHVLFWQRRDSYAGHLLGAMNRGACQNKDSDAYLFSSRSCSLRQRTSYGP